MLEKIFNGFWTAKDFVQTKLSLGEEKPFVIEGAYFLSDTILVFFLVRCVDLSLTNLFKRSLFEKQLTSQELISAMVATLIYVEIPFAWDKMLYLRCFFALCDLMVMGPEKLVKDFTITEVPNYSVIKKSNPIYLSRVQQRIDEE